MAVRSEATSSRSASACGAGEARRAGKHGTTAILSTALGIALLALLAFLSTRYHKSWDWTEAQSHSLTDQSQKVLEGLDQPVQVTALFVQIAAPWPSGAELEISLFKPAVWGCLLGLSCVIAMALRPQSSRCAWLKNCSASWAR